MSPVGSPYFRKTSMTRLPDPHDNPRLYEGVPLKRLLAWVIDTVLVVVICLMILPLTAFIGVFFFPFLVMVISFGYRVITLANGSATLGMRLLAIEMRDGQDKPFDFQHALLHTVGFSFSFAFFLVQVVSMIFMASSERGQGITDLVLNTTALNRRRVR